MQVYNFIVAHWEGIGLGYLMVLKVLTGLQDAVNVEPPDLKPPFGKLLYYMSALSQYLFIGTRPAAINRTPTKVS